MAREVYVLTDADDPSRALVKSFTDETTPDPIVITRSDNSKWRFHWLKRNPQDIPGRPFIYASRPNSFKVGAGIIDAIPTGGTFTLTGPLGGTTAAIAYNADGETGAGSLQTLIRASLTGFGSAVVSDIASSVWEVDKGVTGAVGDITGTSTALVPSGSTVNIVNIQDGTASLNEKWQVRLRKVLPFLHVTGSTAFASAAVTPTLVQAGSSTANKIYSVVWNSDAIDGSVSLAVSTTGSNTQTVGPIPYNATAEEFVNYLANHTAIASTDVSVTKVAPGSYTVMFIGTLDLDNGPTIATASNDLVVPVGDEADIAMSTSGADAILLGESSATITFEIEIKEITGKPRTIVHDVSATLLADLIPDVAGQNTGSESWISTADLATSADATTIHLSSSYNSSATNPIFKVSFSDSGWGGNLCQFTDDGAATIFAVDEDGVVYSAGGYVFQGDQDTGVFSTGANSIGIFAGGSARGTFTSSGLALSTPLTAANGGTGRTSSPTFSAHKNGTDQTGVVTSTFTKVTFGTEDWDTGSYFASSTFTPLVAGKYLLTAFIRDNSGGGAYSLQVVIYKNGAAHKFIGQSNNDGIVGGCCLVDANGSTDTFEVYAWQNSGADLTIGGAATQTYFQGNIVC